MTSWPSRVAAGIRQALIATHSVGAATPGRAIRTEQAPHSPSAQPSLQPVKPCSRRKSSAVVHTGTSPRGVFRPLILTSAATITSSSPFTLRGSADIVGERRNACKRPLRALGDCTPHPRPSLEIRKTLSVIRNIARAELFERAVERRVTIDVLVEQVAEGPGPGRAAGLGAEGTQPHEVSGLHLHPVPIEQVHRLA